MELTEIRIRGEPWWSLGFEATGPTRLLRSELEATAALVFADALPDGVELGTDDSTSYAEWLGQRRRPGATQTPDHRFWHARVGVPGQLLAMLSERISS